MCLTCMRLVMCQVYFGTEPSGSPSSLTNADRTNIVSVTFTYIHKKIKTTKSIQRVGRRCGHNVGNCSCTCCEVGQPLLLGAQGQTLLQGIKELLRDVVHQRLRFPWLIFRTEGLIKVHYCRGPMPNFTQLVQVRVIQQCLCTSICVGSTVSGRAIKHSSTRWQQVVN